MASQSNIIATGAQDSDEHEQHVVDSRSEDEKNQLVEHLVDKWSLLIVQRRIEYEPVNANGRF
jgi:deoxycytidylate deaminase